VRLSLIVACLATTTASWALGPPTVVHTKDGSVYYGTLVERVTGDHVSILTAAGEVKRFKTSDIDPAPPPMSPLYRPPPAAAPIHEIVRTKDGSVYVGEMVERVVGDHVTVKLEGGATKVVAWDDFDPTPLPPAPPPPRTPAPIENVHTVDGSFYHAEVIELVVHDHLTIKTFHGLRTLDWKDIDLRPMRSRLTRADTRIGVDFAASDERATLQRAEGTEWVDVCSSPCYELVSRHDLFRVGGDGVVTSQPFRLGERRLSQVRARVGSSIEHTAGFVLVGLSIPIMMAGSLMALFALDEGPFRQTGLDVATVLVNVGGLAMMVAGAALASRSRDHVTVNGSLLGRIATEGIRF